MNATQTWRAARAQTSSGRYRKAALAGLAAAAIVCGPVAGQPDPAIFGEWNDPPNTGSDWDVVAMHAVNLPTGSILVWKKPVNHSFLWDPVLDTLTEVQTELLINCSGHAGLPDGTILVAGRTEETKVFSLEGLFGGPWQPVDDMTYSRFYPTCTTLPNGRVLATGTNEEGFLPEIFDPGADPLNGTWQVLGIDTDGIGDYYPHMFVVPDVDPDVQKVFYSSGYNAYPFNTAYMLDIGALTWTPVGGDPLFNSWRASAVMYCEPGMAIVLKSGGNSTNGILANTATINLNDATPTWQLEQSMVNARKEHNLVLLPDGKILTVGGAGESGAVKEAEWFDPNDPFVPHWEELAAMTIGRAHHSTAVLLADGRVLSAGGEDGFPGQPDGTAQIFSPPYLFWGARPVIGFAPTVVQYGQEFTVVMPFSGVQPIEKVSFLRLGAGTHGFDQNQRFVKLNFVHIAADTLEVTSPAKPNEAPPGYYMLFLVSEDGVPSVAKYVQLIASVTP